MRLFISYARVDKPYCLQIVDTLGDVHEVWYDRRLHAGQEWWNAILSRLDWCDGVVYLLSPESVASEYCRREVNIAREAGKAIIPVLIQARPPIPDDLKHIHYADVSDGLNPEAVRTLLNAILMAEREANQRAKRAAADVTEAKRPAQADPTVLMTEALRAMDAEQYDEAVFKLKQLVESGYKTRLFDPAASLRQAETALERQAYLREAEREYAPLRSLVQSRTMRADGCEALAKFQVDFPDYDPDGLAGICREAEVQRRAAHQRAEAARSVEKQYIASLQTPPPPTSLPLPFTPQSPVYAAAPVARRASNLGGWLVAGLVLLGLVGAGVFLATINTGSQQQQTLTQIPTQSIADTLPANAFTRQTSNTDWTPVFQDFNGITMVLVPAGCFMMGSTVGDDDELPVHEQCFDAPFWIDRTEVTQADFERFSGQKANANGHNGDQRPVEHITWFEARDFCALRGVRLPTESEWEYAARGPNNLVYPWGNSWNRYNLIWSENANNETANVDSYLSGVSWVGALHLSGNVGEWLNTMYQPYQYSVEDGREEDAGSRTDIGRVLRGGSWGVDNPIDLRSANRAWLNPGVQSSYTGFRCALSP